MRQPKPEEIPPRFLTALCAFLGFVHFCKIGFDADWIVLAFIGLGFLPWMGSVFESTWAGKYRPLQGQGELTEQEGKIVDKLAEVKIPFEKLSYEEKKVLATLWKYQRIHYPKMDAAWTFSVHPRSLQVAHSDHVVFAKGALELGKKGLAGISDNGQLGLTKEGVDYCQINSVVMERWGDTYDKFEN